MICPKCNSEMRKLEPTQTLVSPMKIDYKCPKCQTVIQKRPSQSATGTDSLTIIFYEQKDATG